MADALCIFKPDAAHRVAARAACADWLLGEDGWKVRGLTWFQPAQALVEEHYDFLRGRPFFPWLVDFMSALPVVVGRIEASAEVLDRMRYELGETRIHESRPGSLRERLGIGGGVNVLHLSDAPETGVSEVALWSKHLDLSAIDAQLDRTPERPDHTYHLRSLATQYGAGVHRELARAAIERLLREESDLDDDRFPALARIVVEAFD
ncbi:MAG: nucleoside-diphosphate kinase [Candidatus Dormiibacterota bacterium]